MPRAKRPTVNNLPDVSTVMNPKAMVDSKWLKEKRQAIGKGAIDINKYKTDPVGFARDVLKVTPWDKQAEILKAVGENKYVAVKSGQKIGKTMTAAILAIWFAVCHGSPQTKVVLTAVTYHQVKTVLWGQLQAFYSRFKAIVGGKCSKDPATGWVWPDGRKIIGMTSKDPEGFQGLSGNLFFVIDEASGVEVETYWAIRGNLAGGGKLFAIGNPTKTYGFFFEIFQQQDSRWKLFSLPSWESPNVRAGKIIIPGLAETEFIEDIKHDLGIERYKTHPTWMSRICGEFPVLSDDAVIKWNSIQDAKDRYNAEKIDYDGKVLVGVDVARGRQDNTMLQIVVNNQALLPIKVPEADGFKAAQWIKRKLRQKLPDGKPFPIINVDANGPGVSVVDALRHLDLQVGEVWSQDKSNRPEKYHNLRSELWFGIQDWLDSGGALPQDPEMERELLAARFFLDVKNRYQVLKKEEMKKDLKRSPDRADALALAVYQPRSKGFKVKLLNRRSEPMNIAEIM